MLKNIVLLVFLYLFMMIVYFIIVEESDCSDEMAARLQLLAPIYPLIFVIFIIISALRGLYLMRKSYKLFPILGNWYINAWRRAFPPKQAKSEVHIKTPAEKTLFCAKCREELKDGAYR